MRLTPRQRQITKLVAEGNTNGEVGGILGISGKVVHNHLGRIFDKTGMTGRLELALWWVKGGEKEQTGYTDRYVNRVTES